MALGLEVLIALVLAAFLAGWLDAVVGGGGLIQLPALLIGLPSDTPVATVSGTNKLSSVAGTLTATVTYLRSVALELASGAPLVLFAFLGSFVGARAVQYLPRDVFVPLVLVVLVGVGIFTLRRPSMGLQHELKYDGARHYVTLGILGLVCGVYDGLIGPGTGTFFVIGLVALLGYGFLQASVLAKLANLTTNVAAISVFWHSGNIWWTVALPMAAANLTGGFLGARTALKYGSAFIRRVFLVAILILGARLAWDAWQLLQH